MSADIRPLAEPGSLPQLSWRSLDQQLTLASFAPSRQQRERAIARLSKTSGISYRRLLARIDVLGLNLNRDAGALAIARYQRQFRLSMEGSKLFPRLLGKLNTHLARIDAQRRREMAEPIPLKEAAYLLGVTTHTLRRWVRWFRVMQLDRKGMVTPNQLFEFLNSDWKWLLPINKLPRALFEE